MTSKDVLADEVKYPSRKFLFLEDENKKAEKKRRKSELKARKARLEARSKSGLPFDIDAKKIGYDTQKNSITASGGLIISYPTGIVEANEGEFNISSKEAILKGDVRIGDSSADIVTDYAELNLDSGVGNMKETDIFFPEGDYLVYSKETQKLEEETFKFSDVRLTTCNCPSGRSCLPWEVTADEVEITRNGYGHLYDCKLRVMDVPVFYFPYLIFPVKTDRQTGLLTPTFGGGSGGEVNYSQPFFWAINDSTDATITGRIETGIRYGVELEVRKQLSRQHEFEGALLYFNESARGDDLDGTILTGLADPTIDENRFAGYLDYSYSASSDSSMPFQIIIDGNYVSDDLILREIGKDKIAKFNTRFVTSRGVIRTSLFNSVSVDLTTEYNQALVDDDDFIFHRLPELSLTNYSYFSPFGQNKYGLKLTATSQATAVNFQRKKSYDGMRFELYEKIKTQFHYKNYLEGDVSVDLRATQYSLLEETVEIADQEISEETTDNESEETDIIPTVLKKNSNRLVPGISAKLGTSLEKISESDPDGWFKSLIDLGKNSSTHELTRVKHTFEPELKYRFVPHVSQDENPQFDSLDRLAQKNVVSYGVVKRIFGRFDLRNPYTQGLEETIPRIEELEASKIDLPFDDSLNISSNSRQTASNYRSNHKIKELANFKLEQSFDILEERKDRDPTIDSLSDLGFSMNLFPNSHVKLFAKTNFDVEEGIFASYDIRTQLNNKREDELRLRISSVRSRVRQLEGSLQINISDLFKVGFYSRYDDINSEFIENKFGLRFLSECRCWIFDLDFRDKLNPDKTEVGFTISLVGVGELGNTLFSSTSSP